MSRGETGARGLISPSEAGLRVEAMRGLGPHLSFGSRIASGGHEGLGASFVLRNSIPPGSRERLRGAMGTHLSFGNRIACGGARGREGLEASFVLRKCITPGCHEMTQGPWA